MVNLLLVEDEAPVAEAMSLALTALGHRVDVAVDGPAAVAAAIPPRHDCILLDLMLPGYDGFEVARRVRVTSSVPIIMLTARDDPADIVAGLEVGADDYVTKPAPPRVMDARIRALLRRVVPHSDDVVLVGDLRIDAGAMLATRDGVDLGLTATEMRLLVEFSRNLGNVLSRSVLLDRVWEYDWSGDSRIVDATVQRLRAKIEPDPAHPTFIQTARGLGYRMVQP